MFKNAIETRSDSSEETMPLISLKLNGAKKAEVGKKKFKATKQEKKMKKDDSVLITRRSKRLRRMRNSLISYKEESFDDDFIVIDDADDDDDYVDEDDRHNEDMNKRKKAKLMKIATKSMKATPMKVDNSNVLSKVGMNVKAFGKSSANIDFSLDRITDNELDRLIPILKSNPSLKTLNLSNNSGITNKSIDPLLDLVKQTNIEDINIRNTSISNKNVLLVPLAFNQLRQGTLCRIDYIEKINDDDVRDFCELVKQFEIFKYINFTDKLTSTGAKELFKVLKQSNRVIEQLYLNNNKIDDSCISSLGELFQHAKSINALSLGVNITDEGIKELAPYLNGDRVLATIDFSGNLGITDKSFPDLVEIIKNSNVTKLNVCNTGISPDKLQKLSSLVATPINKRASMST